MRLAWFRANAPRATMLDDSASLIEALQLVHEVEVFASDAARDFAASHERRAFDLPVFELDGATAHTALWPFLSHFRGALMLRTLALPELRETLMASHVAVVPCESIAEDLRALFPGSQVRVAATGVSEVVPDQQDPLAGGGRRSPIFGMPSAGRTDVLRRAIDRAGLGDDASMFVGDRSPEQILREADVIVSLKWPWSGEPATEALAAMAAGKPVIVLETGGTADWPALDPQSWKARGPTREPPVVVSLDPLDEEHSLVLALARLSTDATLRSDLGSAARSWWQSHATPGHAAADWTRILSEIPPEPARQRARTIPAE